MSLRSPLRLPGNSNVFLASGTSLLSLCACQHQVHMLTSYVCIMRMCKHHMLAMHHMFHHVNMQTSYVCIICICQHHMVASFAYGSIRCIWQNYSIILASNVSIMCVRICQHPTCVVVQREKERLKQHLFTSVYPSLFCLSSTPPSPYLFTFPTEPHEGIPQGLSPRLLAPRRGPVTRESVPGSCPLQDSDQLWIIRSVCVAVSQQLRVTCRREI